MRPLPGGRLREHNGSVIMLIGSAYRLRDFQIIGGPAWIHDVGFDIEAKGDANANRAQMMLMLQPHLEDRFQLKFHRETRELPVYSLVVARGGAKLPAPKEGGCVKLGETVPAGPPGSASLPTCGGLNMLATGSGMHTYGGDIPMSELIANLAMVLGRPVLDRTGITTHFDVDFTFTPDDTAAGLMANWGTVRGHRETVAASAAAAAEGDPKAAPNILVAVQERLGLKIESTKGPAEVMVIDHVEKPSAN
jgi:uncharacterized protein (TIGR03435 family)